MTWVGFSLHNGLFFHPLSEEVRAPMGYVATQPNAPPTAAVDTPEGCDHVAESATSSNQLRRQVPSDERFGGGNLGAP